MKSLRALFIVITAFFTIFSSAISGFAMPGDITTVAGDGTTSTTGTYAPVGDGGSAINASLYTAGGMAVDTNGNIYIADPDHNRIRKVDKITGIITTVAGDGAAGSFADNVLATNTNLTYPSGVAVDTNGNIYIAEEGRHLVRRVDKITGLISTVAGTGSPGYNADGIQATAAMLYRPSDVTVDSAGNLYIAEIYGNRIRKVDAATQIITTVAGNGTTSTTGTYAPIGDGGLATNAGLSYPRGVAVDATGNIYIADLYHNSIRKVDAITHLITTVAGNGTLGYTGDAGLATDAQLYWPSDVALDSAGNIYIADYLNQSIRKVDAVTNIITTFAGTGTLGFYGDGGPATAAQFRQPISLAVDYCDNIYIVDRDNNRIRKVEGDNACLPVLIATPPGGSYCNAQVVNVTASQSVTLHCTTDGTTPTVSSPVYVADIPVNGAMTVKCIGVNNLNVQSVVLSQAYTITGGSVWQWGRSVGATPASITGLTDITLVKGGEYHSVALRTGGTVMEWATTPGVPYTVEVSANVPLTNVVSIGAGDSTSYAVKNDGTVWQWSVGGYASQVSGSYPKMCAVAGGYYSLSLACDGTVWAWGSNIYGHLGNGSVSSSNSSTPVQVCESHTTAITGACDFFMMDVRSIAGGAYHNLALKKDGTLWGWGGPIEGAYISGVAQGYVDSGTAVMLPIELTGYSGSIAGISGGGYHSMLLNTAGSVQTAGKNSNGQLGTGYAGSQYWSYVFVSSVGLTTGVKAISAGDFHSLALKNDGTVWAWGDNAYGQTGAVSSLSVSPVQVSGLSNISAIEGGDFHSLALVCNNIPVDTTAPTGSIVINAGAVDTSCSYVLLTLSAIDDSGTVSQMRFSDDNVTWSAWEAYSTYKEWYQTSGNGLKSIYVQFNDLTGNISTAYNDTITASSNGGPPCPPPPPDYTVTFDSNGGSAVSSQTLSYNTTATEPAAPTKAAYTFAGWYSDSGLTTPFVFTTAITVDTTLYAKWTSGTTMNNCTSTNATISSCVITNIPAGQSPNFTPQQAVSLDLTGVNVSGNICITFANPPSNPVLKKFVNGNWGKIYPGNPQFSGISNVTYSNGQICFTIQDNSDADQDPTTGVISDPVVIGTSDVFTVTPSAGTGGSMSPATAQTIDSGATVSFTVTPNTGYLISSVTGCSGALIGNAYTTGAITANCTVTAAFVATIDLTVSALSVPATLATASAASVTHTVANTGAANAGAAFTVGVYLSTDNVITTSDTYLGSYTRASLGAGATYNETKSVTIPASTTPGGYFIGVIVDSSATNVESNESNNTASSAVTVINGVDFVISSLTPPGTITTGTATSIPSTVMNIGTSQSIASNVAVYLSTDNLITTSDTYLGSRPVLQLVAGGTSVGSTSVTIPVSTVPGTYYIGAIADTNATNIESNESNNTASTQVTVAGGVDLTVSALSAPGTLTSGAAVSVSSTVLNSGTSQSTASQLIIYLSKDNVITSADTQLAGRPIAALAAGGTSVGSSSVTVPVSTAPGTYYIGAIADTNSQNGESNESNNTASTQVTVAGGVDLTVSAFSAPASIVRGSTVSVSNTVLNNGVSQSLTVMTRLYLSTDNVITSSDTYLAGRNVTYIAAGGSSSAVTSVTIPSGTAAGTYYIGAITDAGSTNGESNETNNTAWQMVTITP